MGLGRAGGFGGARTIPSSIAVAVLLVDKDTISKFCME